jgi:hypothetical protein
MRRRRRWFRDPRGLHTAVSLDADGLFFIRCVCGRDYLLVDDWRELFKHFDTVRTLFRLLKVHGLDAPPCGACRAHYDTYGELPPPPLGKEMAP